MRKTTARLSARALRNRVTVIERLIRLDRTQLHAVLATNSPAGPHASLVAFVLTKDGRGIVFATPSATSKYRNMKRDPRVSFLIDSRKNARTDYLRAEALSVFGRAKAVEEGARRAELATLLVNKHPALAPFVAAPETVLMHVTISRCVHVGRFQEVTEWRVRKR